MEMMQHFLLKLIFCFLICGLSRTKALIHIGPPDSKSPILKTPQKNPFAPNSEIFKIPVSKTVNLDFRQSNQTKINSELLKILKELFKNKSVKQEKVILNIKPPKNSNISFVKNFTSILKEETVKIVPDAVVGAQSTIFKKKNGEINSLRFTLYVVRQKRSIPIKNSSKLKKNANSVVDKAKINITEAENITATLESVLKQLHENSTVNGNKETNILLSLLSAKNLTRSEIYSLQRSVRQIVGQLYPDASISMGTKLLHNRKTGNSKLEFDIDVTPNVHLKNLQNVFKPVMEKLNITVFLLASNSTEPEEKSISINVTTSIENITKTVDHYLNKLAENEEISNSTGIFINLKLSKNLENVEEQILIESLKNLLQKKFPNFQSYLKMNSKLSNQWNIRILLLSKTKLANEEETLTSESLQANSEILQNDMQNLQPYTRVLKEAENEVKEELGILEKILRIQNKKINNNKIRIDLTKGVSSFADKLEKILPEVLSTLRRSRQSTTLEFEITIPSNTLESRVTDDICSITKTLLEKLPERTQYGDVNIEVTLSNKPLNHPSFTSEDNISPSVGNRLYQAPFQAVIPPITETEENILDLTENEENNPEELNKTMTELLQKLPSQNNARTLNLSMILPLNETDILEDDILDIIKKDVKTLYPYSQLLLQAQRVIADDIHLLKLNIELRNSQEKENKPKKNKEELSIDLSHLNEDIQKDLDELLVPLWSHMNKNKPLTFNLELRPVNDIARSRLSNEICSIVDNLIRSLPSETKLDELSLRMTVTPDNDSNEKSMSGIQENSEEGEKLPPIIVDLTNSSMNITKHLHKALKNLAEELKVNLNSTSGKTTSHLILHLPQTLNIKDTLEEIKDDLSKLAPLGDVVIKSQKDLEDDVLQLELAIDIHHENPRKKFRIELSEMGDFIPEEVDEIVYDIRQSKNPFRFDLQMVIPQDVDLEEGNSEICSVVNVVINNVPQKSILRDNVLRVSVSPKINENSAELKPITAPEEEQKLPEENEPNWPSESNVENANRIMEPKQYASPTIQENSLANTLGQLPCENIPNNMQNIPRNSLPTEPTANSEPLSENPAENQWNSYARSISQPTTAPEEAQEQKFPEENEPKWPSESNVKNANRIMEPKQYESPTIQENWPLDTLGQLPWENIPNNMQNIQRNSLPTEPRTEPTANSESLSENPAENQWNSYARSISQPTTAPEEAQEQKFPEENEPKWPSESNVENANRIMEPKQYESPTIQQNRPVNTLGQLPWKNIPKNKQNIQRNSLPTEPPIEPTANSEPLSEYPAENQWNSYARSIYQPNESVSEPSLENEETVRSPLKSNLLNGLSYISPLPSARNFNQIGNNIRPTGRSLVGKTLRRSTPIQVIPIEKITTENIPITEKSLPLGYISVTSKPLPNQNFYSFGTEETTTKENYLTEAIENFETTFSSLPSPTTEKNEIIQKTSKVNVKVKSKSPKISPTSKSLQPKNLNLTAVKEKPKNVTNTDIWKNLPNKIKNMFTNSLSTEPTTKSEEFIGNPTENQWSNYYTSQPKELEPEQTNPELKPSYDIDEDLLTTVRSPITNQFPNLKSIPLNGLTFPNARNYNPSARNVRPTGKTLIDETKKEIAPIQNTPTTTIITEEVPTTERSFPQAYNLLSWKTLQPQSSYSISTQKTIVKSVENVEHPYLSNLPVEMRITNPETSEVNSVESEQKKYLNNPSEQNWIPSNSKNEDVKEETPIEAYDNDQNDVLRYVETLNLSKSSVNNMTNIITNTTKSILKIIPKENDATLELTLKINPPLNTTVDYLKNVTNSVMSTLLAALPSEIMNVQTKLGQKDKRIVYVEMKITISQNTSLGRDIEEKEELKSKIEKESVLVNNLTLLLNRLENTINTLSKYPKLNTQLKSNKKRPFSETYVLLLKNMYPILSKILLAIKKNPDFKELNLNYTTELPEGEGETYRYLLDYTLRKKLIDYMPSEEVRTNTSATTNQSVLLVQVSIWPRTNFVTPPIDLDDLNILDVEEVLTKIISKYVSGVQVGDSIIIDFVFNTTHISSLNLENIESAIEDVLDYFKLKNELITDDVKLGLIDNKFIIIHIPYKISPVHTKKFSTVSNVKKQKPKKKIPKPSDMISDLILEV